MDLWIPRPVEDNYEYNFLMIMIRKEDISFCHFILIVRTNPERDGDIIALVGRVGRLEEDPGGIL